MLNQVMVPRRLPAISGKAITGILAIALVGSGVGIYRYRQAETANAISYTTSAIQKGDVTNTVTATGPISASSAVPLNFKSSGKLASVNVKVGDQVKAGQVLATLDTSDLQAQLQQAQAALASAQAAYNKATQGPTRTALAAAQAAVNAAGTQVSSAQSALGATQAVALKDTAAAQQALDDANKNLASVQAQIAASTAGDNVAVANAQQALADAQKTAQALPAVIAQQIEQAKDKLYADQVSDDAAVGRGSMSKEARQAALDADQVAIDQANASAQQQLAQSQQTVNQAQSALKTAQAALANDQAKFQGNLVAAQTQANTARSNLASAQAKDAQSLQSAQSAVASASAALATAQANYNSAAAPPTQADIDAAKAQVDSAQAALTLAQNNMNAATLKAPSDGTVTAVNGAVGQWLSGGATSGSAAASASGSSTSSSSISSDFIDLASLSGLQITAQVNEADISKVQIGQPVTFTVDAFPGKTFNGKVNAIQPLGQTTSNVVSYSVISSIDQTDVALLPGMTASASIMTDQAKNVLEVPLSALTYARSHASGQAVSEQPGGSGILIELKDGQAISVPVQFGISDGTHVEVKSGAAKGDQVVTGGGASQAKSAGSGQSSRGAGASSPLTGGGPGGPGGPRG